MDVKTVAVEEETCPLLGLSASRVEDGESGRRGEGCTEVKGERTESVTHCP